MEKKELQFTPIMNMSVKERKNDVGEKRRIARRRRNHSLKVIRKTIGVCSVVVVAFVGLALWSVIKEAKVEAEPLIAETDAGTEVIEAVNSTGDQVEYIELRVANSDETVTITDEALEQCKDNYKAFATVNVREEPSESSQIITQIKADSYCTVINVRDDGWSEVVIGRRVYYVNSSYIGNTIEQYQDYLKEKEAIEESIAESLAVEESIAEAARDKTPYAEYLVNEWGFSYDLQKFLWDEVCAYTSNTELQKQYYAFLLAVIEQESKFGKFDNNKNSNGTVDSGLMQVNSCNWGTLKNAGIISTYSNGSCTELSDNDYTAIKAGMYFMNKIVDQLGVCEGAYYRYNVGHGSGSNKNSKKVWNYYQQWYSLLYSEEMA